MASGIDYSKWKNIEVSDDEDDTHPNVDTPSLFRWRHESRVQRMQEIEQEKKALQLHKAIVMKKKTDLESKKAKGEDTKVLEEVIKMDENNIKSQEMELANKERLTPWNVDTIGQEGFSRTVINKQPNDSEKPLTEYEKGTRLRDFTAANEYLLKKFGILRKLKDSANFLLEYPQLVCDDTSTYLFGWCLQLAIESNLNLLNDISHQFISMQLLLEMAEQLNIDPRACVPTFFSKIETVGLADYKQIFDDRLRLFRERICRRAAEKIAEAEEEERKARIGPGGLDPNEVLESLPEALKTSFCTKDTALLNKTLVSMTDKDARYHIQRCIASGLWVPGGNISEAQSTEDSLEALRNQALGITGNCSVM